MINTDNNQQHTQSIRDNILIYIILFIMTFAVYYQVVTHDFINFDDDIYVTENVRIIKGLSVNNILWAVSLNEKHNVPYWHPLTWMSHMLDCTLFNLNAGMHHLVNLIFHIASTLLLFYLLNLATGAVWRSAMVAALFAIHPVNVESVAWIAERKNVLSTFFWMLTMLFYIYYTKRQNIFRFIAVIISFFLGLLAKPMLITLPFVFLIFDYWPLERFSLNNLKSQRKIFFHIVMEKIPFFIISFCSIYISSVSLKLTGNTISTVFVPLKLRIENAILSCLFYIIKMIWPYGLSVFYPFPISIPLWKVIISLTLIIAVSLFIFVKIKKLPYLTIGWLWFIGTFIPVSGIIQGGLWPEMADRWAYIPYIGLFIAASWGGYEIIKKYCLNNIWPVIISIIVISTLSVAASIQLTYWRNSVSLYNHALRVTPSNPVILNNMGTALMGDGRYSEAEVYLKKALKLKPDYSIVYCNLGAVLYKQGYIKEALNNYSEALKNSPDNEKMHNYYGDALTELGKNNEAMFHYSQAIKINPDYYEPYYNTGLLFFKRNMIKQAVQYYLKAIELNPYYAEAYNNLGLAYYKTGRTEGAVKYYLEALRLKPNLTEAHKNLATVLFDSGDFKGALAHLEIAAAINPKDKEIGETIKTTIKIKGEFQREEKIIADKIVKNPDDYTLYIDLGNLYLNYKRLNLAVEQYKKALIVKANDHATIMKLAKVYAMKGNFSQAISEAERAIALKTDYAYAYYFISSVYSLLNNKEKSIEWLKKSVDKGYNDWDLLRSDKNLYNIRNTPYYMELAEKK